MKQFSTVQFLRFAGLLAWLMYPVGIAMYATQPVSIEGPVGAEDVIGLSSLLVFGVCYWFIMRDVPVSTPTRWHITLLALQLLSGMGVSIFVGDAGLMYVLAAEVPLILKREHSLKWMAVQLLITLPFTWIIYITGHFVSVKELQTVSVPLLIIVTALSVITWQLFAFAVGWLAASEARNSRELARLNMELLAARQSLEEKSRVEERLRISRELHDVMGHHLVALNLQLELASRTIPNAEPSPITTAIRIARDLLAEARKIVSVLRQEQTNDLIRFIRSLQTTIPYPTIHLVLPNALDAHNDVQHALLRCIQEAVSNTLRHSSANNIWITLAQDAEALHLAIRDDGGGFDDAPAGNGIAGMRERVEQLAGTMSLASSRGRGCLIDIEVPGNEIA